MNKRWHIALEQTLSEYMTKRYDGVITADSPAAAIEAGLKLAYKSDAFTPTLKYKVLHLIPW